MLKIGAKNIVISTVGDKSLHRHWHKENTNYDTFLIYYGNDQGYDQQSTYYKKAQGYKYHLIKDTLEENDWICDYDYIWLPDDDVLTCPEDVCRLFELMKEYDLWVAQPSLFGWHGVPVNLCQSNSLLRFTNWVEIMCPCFSNEALKICSSSFKENCTGWSIEGIWNILLNHPRNKIAIIDDISVLHTRKVLTGDTYKDKANPADFAYGEGRATYKKWNLKEEYNKDIPYGKVVKSEINTFVEYGRIEKENKMFPSGHLMKSIISHQLY